MKIKITYYSGEEESVASVVEQLKKYFPSASVRKRKEQDSVRHLYFSVKDKKNCIES